MRQTLSPIYEQSKTFTLCNSIRNVRIHIFTTQGPYWLKQHAPGRLMRWAFHRLGYSTCQTGRQCRNRAYSSLLFTLDGADTSPILHLEHARLSRVQHGSLLQSFPHDLSTCR